MSVSTNVIGLIGVCVMSGVEIPDQAGAYLTPDRTSTNVAVNFESADFFLKKCQSLGIQITSISRHTMAGCKFPVSALELLRTKGGEMGQTIFNECTQAIEVLIEHMCKK